MADDILYTTPVHPTVGQGTAPQQPNTSTGIFGGSENVFDTMHDSLQPIDGSRIQDGHTTPAHDPFFSVATPQETKAPIHDTIPFIPGVKPFHPAVSTPNTQPVPTIPIPTPAPQQTIVSHEPPHPTPDHMIESPFSMPTNTQTQPETFIDPFASIHTATVQQPPVQQVQTVPEVQPSIVIDLPPVIPTIEPQKVQTPTSESFSSIPEKTEKKVEEKKVEEKKAEPQKEKQEIIIPDLANPFEEYTFSMKDELLPTQEDFPGVTLDKTPKIVPPKQEPKKIEQPRKTDTHKPFQNTSPNKIEKKSEAPITKKFENERTNRPQQNATVNKPQPTRPNPTVRAPVISHQRIEKEKNILQEKSILQEKLTNTWVQISKKELQDHRKLEQERSAKTPALFTKYQELYILVTDCLKLAAYDGNNNFEILGSQTENFRVTYSFSLDAEQHKMIIINKYEEQHKEERRQENTIKMRGDEQHDIFELYVNDILLYDLAYLESEENKQLQVVDKINKFIFLVNEYHKKAVQEKAQKLAEENRKNMQNVFRNF